MTYRIDDLEIPNDNPFENDVLDRGKLVEFLSVLIGKLNGPFVMVLDAPWGSGKTTLVRMLRKILEKENFQCTYFNAWKADYASDPLVAMVSTIDRIKTGDSQEADSPFHKHMGIVKKAVPALLKRVGVAAAKLATYGALDLDDAMAERAIADSAGNIAGDVVDLFTRESDLLEKFRSELTEAVRQLIIQNPQNPRKPNLVFFIDELDRCRPTFAIELLERVKHLFDIPNIVFVLSIDKQQLEASAKAIYGAESNAAEYLRRFIDMEYSIPVAPTESYTENLITRFGLDPFFDERAEKSTFRSDKSQFVEFFTVLSNAIPLSLRARERCITRLRVVMDRTPSSSSLHPVLVALLIVLRSNNDALFKDLVSGKASAEDVMGFFESLPGSEKLLSNGRRSIIHAYLLSADPDRNRAEKQTRLLRECKDERSAEIIEVGRHIREISKGALADIAAKIDLSINIR